MQPSQWFVVQTNPQRETFVGEQLSDLDPYLPKFKTERGKVAPLFPGYLFVPAVADWSPIKNTVGVRTVLMSSDHPALIDGTVIKGWRSRERGGLIQLPPRPRFLQGQRLTITRGSLRYRQVIHAGMASRDRERVLIEMLGQQVTIVVASADLAPEFRPPPRNGLRRRREPFMWQDSRRSA